MKEEKGHGNFEICPLLIFLSTAPNFSPLFFLLYLVPVRK